MINIKDNCQYSNIKQKTKSKYIKTKQNKGKNMANIYVGFPPPNVVKWIKDEAERKQQKTPLTFTAEQAGAKLSLISVYGPAITLETSTTGEEGSWQPYTVGTEITLANVRDKVMFRNSSDTI